MNVRYRVELRNEAAGFTSLAVEAEVAHNTLAIAARVCGEMTLRCAPRIKGCMIEVDTAVLHHEATQRFDDLLLMDIRAPK